MSCLLVGAVGAADVNDTVTGNGITDNGTVGAGEISDVQTQEAVNIEKNVNNDGSADNQITDNNKLSTSSESGTEVTANNWNELKDYASSNMDDYVIYLAGNSFVIGDPITFGNSATVVGSEASYITGGDNSTTPFVNTANDLSIKFVNVSFKDINALNLFEVAGTVSFENCSFDNVVTANGHNSVLYNTDGTMDIVGCNFTNCHTGYGVITNYKSGDTTSIVVNVYDSKFINNNASVEPGAINNCGVLNVDNSEFISNYAKWWAGAIHTHYYASTFINNSVFRGNVAGWNGGVLFTYSNLTVFNSLFEDNNCTTNTGGGAIGTFNFVSTYNLIIDSCVFNYNNNLCNAHAATSTSSDGRGGAISVTNGGYLTLTNSNFTGNYAKIGQAICAATATYENATGGRPHVDIHDNIFINHTYTDSDTVVIDGNDYLFYGNTFINSYQNNTYNNSGNTYDASLVDSEISSVNKLSSVKPTILKDDNTSNIRYVNASKGALKPSNSQDGLTWETAWGKGGVSWAMIHDGKIIYITGFSQARRGAVNKLKHDGDNFTIIGVNGTVFKPSVCGNFTFINMTFENLTYVSTFYNESTHINQPVSLDFINCYFVDSIVYISGNGTCRFVNCSFVNSVQNTLINYTDSNVSFINCTFENVTANSVLSYNLTYYDMYTSDEEINDDYRNILFDNCDFTQAKFDNLISLNSDVTEEDMKFDVNGSSIILFNKKTEHSTYMNINFNGCSYPSKISVGVTEVDGNYYINSTSDNFNYPRVSSMGVDVDVDGSVVVSLVDDEGNAIANAVVVCTVNGTEYNITTDDSGVARISNVSGKFAFTASYAGEKYITPYDVSMNIFIVERIHERLNTVIVSDNFTQTAVDMGNGERGGNFTVRLADADGNPLAGKLVYIGFNGKVYNRTTDANGFARLAINLRTAGDYTFATSFLGDDDYKGSFVVNTVKISKKVSRLVLSGNSAVKVNAYRTLTVSLQGQRALNHNSYITAANKTVKVTVNGKTYSVRIGANKKGTLRVRFTRAGTYTITTKFAGDGTYSARTLTSKITVRR